MLRIFADLYFVAVLLLKSLKTVKLGIRKTTRKDKRDNNRDHSLQTRDSY